MSFSFEVVPVTKGDIVHETTNFHGTITHEYYLVDGLDISNGTIIFRSPNGQIGEYTADTIVRNFASLPKIIENDSQTTEYQRLPIDALPINIRQQFHL